MAGLTSEIHRTTSIKFFSLFRVSRTPSIALLFARSTRQRAFKRKEEPWDAVAAKWTLRYQNVFSAGIDIARIDYNKAVLFVTPSEIDPGPDVLNYSNAPSDVSDGLGRDLAAFENKPI